MLALFPATAAAVGGPALGAPAAQTPATTTPVAPAPAKGSVTLRLPDLFNVHKQLVAVQGRGFTAVGTVTPYVAGQYVTVQELLGKRSVKRVRALVKPSKGGRGSFSVRLPTTGG